MKTNSWSASLTVRTLVILSLFIGSALQGNAQENSKAQKTGSQAEGTARTADRTGGPQESIKVHGHWTIVIRNEDGSVASHHEFNNALHDQAVLPILLSRQAIVKQNSYVIDLSGDPICGVTSNDQTVPAICEIFEGTGTSNGQLFFGLTATAVNGTLQLAGSAKASFPGRITFVTTILRLCLAAGVFCDQHVFTFRDLRQPEPPSTTPPPPINVLAGQTVDITVTISFS